MLANTVLSIEQAPFIVLYNKLFDSNNKGKKEDMNIALMQYAHGFMFLVNVIAVVFVYYYNAKIGFAIAGFIAIMKTVATFGFCPIASVSKCSMSGCCVFKGKKKAKKK